jgi:hypothetical protein
MSTRQSANARAVLQCIELLDVRIAATEAGLSALKSAREELLLANAPTAKPTPKKPRTLAAVAVSDGSK